MVTAGDVQCWGFASVSLGPESELGRSCVPENRPFFYFLPSFLFSFFSPATDGRSQLRLGNMLVAVLFKNRLLLFPLPHCVPGSRDPKLFCALGEPFAFLGWGH